MAVSCEIHSFQSSLNVTTRNHPCPYETVTFYCSSTGTEIGWTSSNIFSGELFFYTRDPVNEVIASETGNAVAVLRRTDRVSDEIHQFESILIVNFTSHVVGSISCSSDNIISEQHYNTSGTLCVNII